MDAFANPDSIGRKVGLAIIKAEKKNTTAGFQKFWPHHDNGKGLELKLYPEEPGELLIMGFF